MLLAGGGPFEAVHVLRLEVIEHRRVLLLDAIVQTLKGNFF